MMNTPQQDNVQPDEALPPSLRFLKGLVITLMITMILGVITVVGVLVTRMPDGRAQIPAMPESITLPSGARAEAVTFGKGWIAVVTQAQTLLIYDSVGKLLQTIPLAAVGAAQ